MPAWGKFVVWLMGCIFIASFGILPEILMWIIWRISNPDTSLERTVLGVVFVFFGGSASIGFAVMATMIGLTWTATIADA